MHSVQPVETVWLGRTKTKLWVFSLPAFPVKRSREDNEAHGSGSEPQRKRQKDERKTEPDGSSASPSSHRWKATLANTCSCCEEAAEWQFCTHTHSLTGKLKILSKRHFNSCWYLLMDKKQSWFPLRNQLIISQCPLHCCGPVGKLAIVVCKLNVSSSMFPLHFLPRAAVVSGLHLV